MHQSVTMKIENPVSKNWIVIETFKQSINISRNNSIEKWI